MMDTTRLQPVVLHLRSYSRLYARQTPPGFSRWYFTFVATRSTLYLQFRTPPGFSRWYFNFVAATEPQCDLSLVQMPHVDKIEEPAKAWWCFWGLR